MTTSQKISLKIERAWLLLPVSESAPDCRVSLLDASGHEVRLPFTAALSAEPQSWAPLPVGAWVGQTLELTAATTRDGQTLPELSALPWSQHDTPYAHQQLYREPLRPLIHFTAPYGWLNDPNGLTFFNGEYHLFYQHNPFGTRWGNMHWGHATSTDLFSWTDWGDVLEPDHLGPVFSGSAFVDETNEYGLGELSARPTLILVFTAAGNPCTQCLAWSQDGRTFRRYEKNPVILNLTPGNRDPKLFHQNLNGTAHLALYTRREDEPHTITFLSSTDLRSWDITGEVQGDDKAFLYECPDCFQLKTPAGKTYWVLLAANGEYAIGQFDGKTFHPEHTHLRTCRNDVMYAAQTFNHLPDDRRLLIGWLRVPAPGMPFSQCMSIPINLSLVDTHQGPRLAYYPAPEITKLVKTGRHEQTPPQAIGRIFQAGDTIPTIPYEPPSIFALSLEVAPEGIFDVQFNGVSLVFNAPKSTLTANNKTYPWPIENSLIELTIVIDRTVMEIFSEDGLNYLAIPAHIEPGTPVITVREGDIKCILTVSRSLQPARLSSKLA